jgi:aquaporin Z
MVSDSVVEGVRAWWAYLVGPLPDAAIAVGIAHLLRGPGGGAAGTAAAQGTLGTGWVPGRIGAPGPAPPAGQPTPGERPADPGPDDNPPSQAG